VHPGSLPKALCPTQHAIQKPNLQTNHAHQKPCHSGAHPSTPDNANPAIQKPAALATPPTYANLQLEAHKFLPKALRPTQHVIQKPAPCKETMPARNPDPPICAILEPFNPPRSMQTLPSRSPQPWRQAPPHMCKPCN